jgi:hypothetical protein
MIDTSNIKSFIIICLLFQHESDYIHKSTYSALNLLSVNSFLPVAERITCPRLQFSLGFMSEYLL